MSAYSAKQVENALSQYGAQQLRYVAGLCPSRDVTDLFRIKYDYHNLKTIMKSEAAGALRTELLSDAGRIPVGQLVSAWQEEKYLALPELMSKALVEARAVLAHSANPQQSDFILDRAYFAELKQTAEELKKITNVLIAKVLISQKKMIFLKSFCKIWKKILRKLMKIMKNT